MKSVTRDGPIRSHKMKTTDEKEHKFLSAANPINSTDLLHSYFFDALNLWERARAYGLNPTEKKIRLCDETIELVFADERLLPFFMPALEHLVIMAGDVPAIKIYIWDDATTHTVMPNPPWWRYGVQNPSGQLEGVFTRRGDLRGFQSEKIKAAFNWSANALSMYDAENAVGFYWTRDAKDLPAYETSAPLRTILNWRAQQKNCHVMHGAVVGTACGGVLLAGKGGSGKSTAALAALKDGLYYVSDDYCLVSSEPEPAAYCVFSSAKVDPGNLFRAEHILSARSKNHNPYDDKEVFFLYPQFAEQIKFRLPLQAILLPRITGNGASRLTEASKADAIKALTVSTVCQFPGAGKQAVDIILSLVNQLPCYIFDFGTDLSLASETIVQLLKKEDLPR